MLALVAAIVIWGANWPIMKAGLSHVSPLWFSSLRFATGAACLFAFQAIQGRVQIPRRADWPFIGSIGLLQMTSFTALGAVAMTHLPAGRSAILSYTTPIWTAPIAIGFFGERATPARTFGILLGVIGVIALVNPFAIDWSNKVILGANAMLLAAAGCWAFCIVHLRHFKANSSAFTLAPWQMTLAALILTCGARIFEGPFTGDGSPAFWAATLFVGPVATAFCFCAVNAASTWLAATTMSMTMLGVPLTGAALSVATLGEAVTPSLLAGASAIAAGIAVTAIPTRKMTHKMDSAIGQEPRTAVAGAAPSTICPPEAAQT
ncbi:DMT family transporter [Gluconacetobacter tumulicola]|uniref:DMT family transporter n=1 Tax=Gluconacetobacter tumulicola TaxID=1017177 RepID=A0A7W4JCE3_9PROT|nr:DMT family transporter [Gluconacetobacter tumulicola]